MEFNLALTDADRCIELDPSKFHCNTTTYEV
jgi:hypothetical protein